MANGAQLTNKILRESRDLIVASAVMLPVSCTEPDVAGVVEDMFVSGLTRAVRMELMNVRQGLIGCIISTGLGAVGAFAEGHGRRLG